MSLTFGSYEGQPFPTGFLDAAVGDEFDVAAQLGIKNHFSAEECEFLTQLLVLLHQENPEPLWTEGATRDYSRPM
ncbi:MAG: hypothetical protein U0936_02765 [Planctomycetaceae bacterium]